MTVVSKSKLSFQIFPKNKLCNDKIILEKMLSQRSRLVGGVVRTLSTSCRLDANHYDILGITPKATQTDIKTAYYELSKVYHPDRSSDEESAKKFRLIAEAYEVLGNVSLKKMYDKGLLVGREGASPMGYQPEEEPDDPKLKFYKSRTRRAVAPTMDGKTPIYNFDDWSRNHYGTLFDRAQYDKEQLRKKREKQQDSVQSTQQETLLLLMVAISGVFIVLVLNGTPDYDTDKTQIRQKESKPDGPN